MDIHCWLFRYVPGGFVIKRVKKAKHVTRSTRTDTRQKQQFRWVCLKWRRKLRFHGFGSLPKYLFTWIRDDNEPILFRWVPTCLSHDNRFNNRSYRHYCLECVDSALQSSDQLHNSSGKRSRKKFLLRQCVENKLQDLLHQHAKKASLSSRSAESQNSFSVLMEYVKHSVRWVLCWRSLLHGAFTF